MPQGYTLPPKDARYVKNIIAWGKELFARNDRFIGMTFFNEVKLPEENRQAVYESINSKDSSHALSANRSS
jgi:hypothetical protein